MLWVLRVAYQTWRHSEKIDRFWKPVSPVPSSQGSEIQNSEVDLANFESSKIS